MPSARTAFVLALAAAWIESAVPGAAQRPDPSRIDVAEGVYLFRSPGYRMQFVDWYLHRAYEELDGPLTDAIAPIPQH